MTIRQPGRPLFGEAGFQRFSSLLGNMMIRTTAQATLSAALRKVDSISVHGATVRATTPGGQYATVHIDGDAPGQTTQVPLATWEYFEVGQRVVVMLFPPSGALVIGYTGRPPGWTQYPSDYSPWYSSNRKTPTFTTLHSDVTQPHPTAYVETTESVTAGRLLVVMVSGGTQLNGSDALSVTVTNTTGSLLTWTRAVDRAASWAGDSGTMEAFAEIWWAYATVTESINIRASINGDTTGIEVMFSVVSIQDAEPLQTGAAVAEATVTFDTTPTVNVVKAYDHGNAVCAVYGSQYTGLATWNPGPDAGDTEILQAPLFSSSTYRGGIHTRLTTSPAAAGSQTLGSGSGTPGDSFVIVAMEIIAVPDVPVIGDGSMRAAFRLDGTSLELRLGIAAGSTTTFGGGPHALRLPPGMIAAPLPVGGLQQISGVVVPAGTNRYRAIAEITAGASYFDKIIYQDASTTYLSSTAPVAMTSAMKMGLGGVIEVAPG